MQIRAWMLAHLLGPYAKGNRRLKAADFYRPLNAGARPARQKTLMERFDYEGARKRWLEKKPSSPALPPMGEGNEVSDAESR